jgi:hypothetical protein
VGVVEAWPGDHQLDDATTPGELLHRPVVVT